MAAVNNFVHDDYRTSGFRSDDISLRLGVWNLICLSDEVCCVLTVVIKKCGHETEVKEVEQKS